MRLFIFLFLVHLILAQSKQKQKNVLIDNISDIKDLKKLFRTKTNVLVLFISSAKEAQNVVRVVNDAAVIVKGEATVALIDCSLSAETKKLCKKMKVTPEPVALKHYKDGNFHKDYDRQLTVSSLVNFLRDPTGDLPWEEDPAGKDVLHVKDVPSLFGLIKAMKKESRPMMMMFYTPWCGFCKRMKPDYAAAAKELKPDYILAAIDVNRPENMEVRKKFGITSFPTLIYFEDGTPKFPYEGKNEKQAIIDFMKDPKAPKEKEAEWSIDPDSEIVHLTDTNFEVSLKDEESALVMFYAPWCGHCQQMKPQYEKAAVIMKEQKIPGVLAAIDATKEKKVATEYKVKGYPTLKYFSYGEFKFDVNVRETEQIIKFMKSPSEESVTPPPTETNWEDEETNVVHLNDENFKSYLKKKKHVLLVFYAPWCGHCKRAKPEFSKAAEEFIDEPLVGLAAVDCTRYQSLCSAYSVKGFPTFKYFSYFKTVRDYNGGRTADDFVKFLSDPDAPPPKPKVEEFGTYPGSDSIEMLTDDNFDKIAKATDNLLVMFYAPWCGHCTKFKPQFSEAAQRVKKDKIGLLGAVDATVQRNLAQKHDISGFPTLKLFKNGVFKSEYDGKRTVDDLYKFMKKHADPKKDEL